MARLPEGAGHTDVNAVSSPPPRGVIRRSLALSHPNGESPHGREWSFRGEFVDELLSVVCDKERCRVAPGVAELELEERDLRAVGCGLAFGIVQTMLAERRRSLEPLEQCGG